MSVVQQVLEMLRASLPSFEFDEKHWRAQARRAKASAWEAEAPAEPPRSSRPRGSKNRRTRSQAPPDQRRRYRSRSSSSGRGGESREPRVDTELERLYAQLELPCGANFTEIRAAWKRLVREHHPDFHATDPERQEATTELVKVYNNAYQELRKKLQAEEP